MRVVQIGPATTGSQTVTVSAGGSAPQVVEIDGTTGGVSPGDLTGAIQAHRADPAAHPGYAQATAQVAADLAGHVVSPEPHPEYDDLPSLYLIFENGLV